MPDFIPSKDADLVTWSNNFNTLIGASATTYGLTAGDAIRFSGLHSTFVGAYQTSQDSSTRSPSAVIAKDDARDELVENARELARIVQATPSVTDKQKSDLQLTVRDDEPSPVPRPTSAPNMSIESMVGRTVKIRLRDADNPDRRGKPDGVDGATVLIYVGDSAPADPLEWTFFSSTTHTTFFLTFPASIAAGSKAWLTAFWFNTKSESGPSAVPISARVDDGLAQAA